MAAGEVLGDRFTVLEVVRTGGMGTIYRATDRESGAPAAIKVLHSSAAADVARFHREARTLSEIAHPNVVRYLMHSVTRDQEPYLAMEWLDGEDLQERLSRGRLSIEESVTLARVVARALEAAHAKGIVHLDVKPSNLFLVGGKIEDVKVLDFGVARFVEAKTILTLTGSTIGTPGYMSPELVRGERDNADARADVFSLGCVLFECLTGRPAFVGTHPFACLAKVLFETPPRVVSLCPDVPPGLDLLVARTLAKTPDSRPASAAAVIEALDRITVMDAAAVSGPMAARRRITDAEMRLCSVVTLRTRQPGEIPAPGQTTLSPGNVHRSVAEVQRVVEPFGAKVEALADGVLVAVLTGVGHATDQVALAARCALRMRSIYPDAVILLVTSRSHEADRVEVGALLERSAALLQEAGSAGDHEVKRAGGDLSPQAFEPIQIDEVTRALLDLRFDVTEHGGHILLRGERDEDAGMPSLLGKPSPFVGRERELRSLVDLVEESLEEAKSRAILVTADAGMGKSRLRQEMVRRLRESHPDLVLGFGRADSVGAGAAYHLLGTAFRLRYGFMAGTPLETQRQRLAFAMDVLVEKPHRQRVTEFIGEMIGTPFPDDDSPMLQAARRSPALMAEQIQAAYIDVVRLASSTRPTVVVIEDMHWGDAPSMKLIDAALRELRKSAYVVVAFARPEVHARFPKLWEGRDVHEIRLSALPSRAAQRVVREALGNAVDEEKVAELVARADGNVLYLEELIRAVAHGRGDTWPPTVLGMVTARLANLDADSRKLLRAASVFGELFWAGGVAALLGEDAATLDAEGTLQELVGKEFLVRHPKSQIAGQDQYAFRHAMLREGAYAMLTDEDRTLGHRLAGEWLASHGEVNARLLAEHFDRGGDEERAAELYLRAVEQALDGGDFRVAAELAERGLALGREPEVHAALRVVRGNLALWGGDLERALAAASEALALAPQGSRSACTALSCVISAALVLRRPEALEGPLELLLRVEPDPDAISALTLGFNAAIIFFVYMGQRSAAERCFARLDVIARGLPPGDAAGRAGVARVRADFARFAEHDPWTALGHDLEAVEQFERASDPAQAAFAAMHLGFDLALLGQFERADSEISRGSQEPRLGSLMLLLGEYFQAASLLMQGRLDEAEALAARALKRAADKREGVIRVNLRLLLAASKLRRGDLDAAEQEVLALGEGQVLPYQMIAPPSLLAEIRLQQGRSEEAVARAKQAASLREAHGKGHHLWHASMLLVLAESLQAAGDLDAAREAIREAKADVLASAAKITDPGVLRTFLESVPVHARTLALAGELLPAGS